MIRYKGAWWVDSPAAVATLAAAGFNVHLIPYLSARQVDDCLAAFRRFQAAETTWYGALGLSCPR